MKSILLALCSWLFATTLYGQAITEGAPVSIKLSGKYLVPSAKYTINGQTQVGNKAVTVKLELLQAATVLETTNITTDTKGGFKLTKTAPNSLGTYTIKMTGADGKKSITETFIVSNPGDVGNLVNDRIRSSVMLAFRGLEAANDMVKKLPPSAAKDEFKNNYVNTRKGLDEAAAKLQQAKKDLVGIINVAAKYPPVLEEAQKYLSQIEATVVNMESAEKNFEQQVKQSEQQAVVCDQLNFIAEAAGFISLVLDFQGKVAKVFLNLASDKVMPGAVDRMDWAKAGKTGQSAENAKMEINTTQKALTASALGFSEFLEFAKTGFMLDFIQFVAKGMYGKFCEEMKGPFTGSFRAEFDAGTKGMWNSYDMAMKGQLILRYEKGSNSKTGYAVTGEFEGVYTKYDFWEDFEKVEELPKNMMLLMRKKEVAKPIDLSAISIPAVSKDPKTGKTKVGSTNLDINNDVGMIARQLLPGSFRIKVKGVVKDNKITLKVDEGAVTNMTNVGQNNKLILVAASPILPIPLVKTFEFPMAPAKSVFAVGIGPEQVFELTTSNGQTISKKKIDNSRQLEKGSIRLRTKLDITVGTN